MSSSEFLGAISEFSERFILSQSNLWGVKFLPGFTLGTEVDSVLRKAGEKWSARYSLEGFQNVFGSGHVLVAREVNIPGETVEIVDFGQDNRGGFLPGFGVTQRSSFLQRNVTITFLDTREDIIHGFLRPWCIAVGVDGMLNTNLKADIEVVQYDNDGDQRKGFMFKDAFPTNVEGFTLSHDADDFITTQVSFACRNYEASV